MYCLLCTVVWKLEPHSVWLPSLSVHGWSPAVEEGEWDGELDHKQHSSLPVKLTNSNRQLTHSSEQRPVPLAQASVRSQGLVDVKTSTNGSEIVRHERSYCVTSMHVSFTHRHILMSRLTILCCLDPIINILPAFILGGLFLHGNVPHIDYFQQIVLISIRPAFIPNH